MDSDVKQKLGDRIFSASTLLELLETCRSSYIRRPLVITKKVYVVGNVLVSLGSTVSYSCQRKCSL